MQEIFACGIQNLGKFACGIRNPGFWNPEYSSRNPESRKFFGSGIQFQLTKDWNPVIGNWNPQCGIQNPEAKTVLDSLTWGKSFLPFLRLWQAC